MKRSLRPGLFVLFHLLATSYAAGAAVNPPACQGGFQGNTVKIIVAHAVGGGYDLYARIFAPHYENITGAKVLVENWPAGKGRVGVNKIIEAPPDGLTIGLVNAPKRIADNLLSSDGAPDIVEDSTILARLAGSQYVLLVGAESTISGIGALLNRNPPPILGVSSLRSGGGITATLVADLLDMDFEMVSGLGGTRKRILAASRGDVDFIASSFHSVISDIESGTVRPLLQISGQPISDHPSLMNVPLLGGKDGLATGRAEMLNSDVDEALHSAQVIESLSGAGRVFIAPPNLPDYLESCLQEAILTTLEIPAFINDIRKANLVLNVSDGRTAKASLREGVAGLRNLLPVLERKINGF